MEIGPGMQMEPAGRQVKYYTDRLSVKATYTNVNASQVVWLTDGAALVYSYLFKQWSVWTAHECDVACFDGVHAWWIGDNSGSMTLSKQVDDYDDNGDWIETMIVTPWFSADGLGGSARYFAAEVMGYNNDASGHRLYLAAAYDFDKVFTGAASQDVSTLSTRDEQYDGASAGSAGSAHLVRYDMRDSRGTSVRFKVYDGPPDGGGTNQGPDLGAIIVEARPYDQSHKIDRGRKAAIG